MSKADPELTTFHFLALREPADGLPVIPLSDAPDVPRAALRVLHRMRGEMEAEIERLITLRDMLDGDPDLEPSSGDIPPAPYAALDDAEPNVDDEPSLGLTEEAGDWGF